MIKTVLIDVDNTLLCFYKCAEKALNVAFTKNGIEFKKEYLPYFFSVNDRLWRMVEDRVITRQDVYEIRLRSVFNTLAIDGDARRTEDCFVKEMERTSEPVSGALETLKYLSSKYKVYGASNSVYERQQSRLKLAGFYEYFDELFVSDRIGAEKPAEQFFNYCLKNSKTSAEECVMIGDSLNADMAGAKNVGIMAIWYNHAKIAIPENKPYDYMVDSLFDVKNIL